MTDKIKALPSKGEQNGVSEVLQSALLSEFDEVFVVGVKDGMIRTTWSNYKGIEHKLGQLELLKINMITDATQ